MLTIKKAAVKTVEAIHKDNPELSEIQMIKMQYGIECFLHEFIKIIVFLLAFSLLGFEREFMVVLAFMLLLRPVLGGYHARTGWRCYLESLIFLSAAVFLGRFIQLNVWVKAILALCSLAFTVFYAPVDHPNKPEHDPGLRKIFKILSAVMVVIALGVSGILPGYYSNIGFFTVIGVVLLAVIGKLVYQDE